MSSDQAGSGQSNMERIIAEAKADQAKREKTYRGRAMKMFPHVCGRCGREFAGKQLSELTVHHKDHNHDNNPPDGSNWELLCIYCHDNEHQRDQTAEAYGDGESSGSSQEPMTTHNPFANLGDMLKSKK